MWPLLLIGALGLRWIVLARAQAAGIALPPALAALLHATSRTAPPLAASDVIARLRFLRESSPPDEAAAGNGAPLIALGGGGAPALTFAGGGAPLTVPSVNGAIVVAQAPTLPPTIVTGVGNPAPLVTVAPAPLGSAASTNAPVTGIFAPTNPARPVIVTKGPAPVIPVPGSPAPPVIVDTGTSAPPDQPAPVDTGGIIDTGNTAPPQI